MKKIIILLIFLSFNSIFAESNDKKSDKKLEFTKEEFRKAVYAELDKKMKKIGRSKLLDFAKELLIKEESLLEREKKSEENMKQVKIAETDLKKKIIEFQNEQRNFLACLDKEDKEVAKRMRHMVDVVSGMKPQTAANLLSQQDPSISVEIMGKLDPVKVSKIFNLMDKEVSAKLQKQYMTLKK